MNYTKRHQVHQPIATTLVYVNLTNYHNYINKTKLPQAHQTNPITPVYINYTNYFRVI